MGTRERQVAAGVPSADGVQPVPPRHWWLKRLGAAALLLLLALVGLRLWWGSSTCKRPHARNPGPVAFCPAGGYPG